MALRVEGIHLSVGYSPQRPILENLNFSFSVGELVALTGRNGSGKSTLLRTLAGGLKPISGKILLQEGNEHCLLSEDEHSKHYVAFLPSHLLFAEYTTVSEFVALGRFKHLGWFAPRTQHDHEMVERALCEVGLSGFETKIMAELSDGQRQRASIAFVLVQETPVLLLDEPTAFLDYVARQEIVQLLSFLAHKQSRLVLYATHDIELAERYIDRRYEVEATKSK